MRLLTLESGQTVVAHNHPFQLSNGFRLACWQINGLASDFCGTVLPISETKTQEEQSQRFCAAYENAERSSRQPGENLAVLEILKT